MQFEKDRLDGSVKRGNCQVAEMSAAAMFVGDVVEHNVLFGRRDDGHSGC